jgi:hypothetical protein
VARHIVGNGDGRSIRIALRLDAAGHGMQRLECGGGVLFGTQRAHGFFDLASDIGEAVRVQKYDGIRHGSTEEFDLERTIPASKFAVK